MSLKNFTIVLFYTLYDEEDLMIRGRISSFYKKDHGMKHISLLRELIQFILKACEGIGWKEEAK